MIEWSEEGIEMGKQLVIYTREPSKELYYDPRLAYSMHLAYVEDGKAIAFNHNSGVFFAKATENEDGSLNPKSLIKPIVIKENETFIVVATRIAGDGEADYEDTDKLLVATTKDFIHYEELPMSNKYREIYEELTASKACRNATEELPASKACSNVTEELPINKACSDAYAELPTSKACVASPTDTASGAACGQSQASTACPVDFSGIVGGVFSQIIEVPDEVMDYLKKKLCPMKVQSDGPIFNNPIAINRADPDVYIYNGKYYYIATNDADENHTLYVREADRLEDIPTAKEHLILDSDMYEDIKGLLWAPEFHEVNGKLYIFHAATRGEFFAEESRLMELKEGGNPINASDWSKPRRIVKMDGSELAIEGKEITLDMTCFKWEDEYYVIWSQRQFLPKDLGAWLYIAKLNPKKPWMLASEPVVLSKPDYGWGNNHTFVEEGPFALIRGDVLYITFSAAAVDESYVISYLKINRGEDLLNPKAWYKNNYPILTARSVEGEYGTGHNAYVIDPKGRVWNAYHARFGATAPRSSAIRQVFFDVDGAPVLDAEIEGV